jgi:hypothetical protein
MSKIASYIIHKALKYVPPDSQERYKEEWTAHLNDCPSGLRKVGHAIGCFYAALRIDLIFPLLVRLYFISIVLFFIEPISLQIGYFYLAKTKLCLLASKFMRRIGAITIGQRLQRAGLSLARTSFHWLDLYFACRLFQRIPQHCPSVRSLIYYKAYTATILYAKAHIISQRRSSTQIIRAALGTKPAKVEKQPLPEFLRLASEFGMFPTQPLRMKWHRRIR